MGESDVDGDAKVPWVATSAIRTAEKIDRFDTMVLDCGKRTNERVYGRTDERTKRRNSRKSDDAKKVCIYLLLQDGPR